MKSIKEVEEQLGITRRTLQEYDRIDLLSPSNKEEIKAGKLVQWKYDEDALDSLKLITLFVEVGYKRNDIKAFIKDPKKLKKEFMRLEKKLEEKKSRIDTLLNEVKASRILFEMPVSMVSEIVPRAEKLIKERGWDVEKMMKDVYEYVDIDDPDTRDMFKLQTVFEGIAFFDESSDDEIVQRYIYRLFSYYCALGAEHSDEHFTKEEIREGISQAVKEKESRQEFVNDICDVFSEVLKLVDQFYGKGKEQYIRDALGFFADRGLGKNHD